MAAAAMMRSMVLLSIIRDICGLPLEGGNSNELQRYNFSAMCPRKIPFSFAEQGTNLKFDGRLVVYSFSIFR